ncbi:MAG: prepilin-type N-terminal cleavage/methylation domain-containing protein [Planctomycetota bacterium]|nr:prepilin-type N-terminal cleavage/methylation domain-containing protein [Planctomycetota bacterium]
MDGAISDVRRVSGCGFARGGLTHAGPVRGGRVAILPDAEAGASGIQGARPAAAPRMDVPSCLLAVQPRVGRGFTLVELLVALTIVLIAFAMSTAILVWTAKLKRRVEGSVEQTAAARIFFSQFLRDLCGAYPDSPPGRPPALPPRVVVVGSFKDASGLDHDIIEVKTATDLVPEASGDNPFANVGDYYRVRYYAADGVLYREVNPTGDPDAWSDPAAFEYANGSEFLRYVRQLVVNPLRYSADGWVLLPWGDHDSIGGYEIVLHVWDQAGLSGTSGFREFRCRVPVPEALK